MNQSVEQLSALHPAADSFGIQVLLVIISLASLLFNSQSP